MPAITKRRAAQQVEFVPTPTDHMQAALASARNSMEHTRAALIRDMRQMQSDLDRAIRRLEHGVAPNALGELQATTTMIDAKCGSLAAQQEAYERLDKLASRLGLLPPVADEATTGEGA